jgi:hypothetical protein
MSSAVTSPRSIAIAMPANMHSGDQQAAQTRNTVYRSAAQKAANFAGSAIATAISATTLATGLKENDHAQIALGGAALATNFFDCIQKLKYIHNTSNAGLPEPIVRKGCPLSGGLAIAAAVLDMVRLGSSNIAGTVAYSVGSALVATDALATTASQEQHRKETQGNNGSRLGILG